MSMKERILQIQREQAAAVARNKEDGQGWLTFLLDLRAGMNEAKEKKQREVSELEQRRSKVDRVLKESGVLNGLRLIEEGLRGNVKKYELRVSLDAMWSNRHTLMLDDYIHAKLVWGNKYTMRADGYIDMEKSFFGESTADCCYIEVDINPHTEDITINGVRVKKNDWESNKEIIEDVLVEAYRNPLRPGYFTEGGFSDDFPRDGMS